MLHGPRDVPAVSLTFHGAGDPRLAEQILSLVERAGASVSVLAVGTWLDANPSIGDRILRGGHDLGNHTMHHLPMRTMNTDAAYAEISAGLRRVARYTTAPTWFRPSGLPRATPRILAAAGRAGYATSVSFDVDPRDYQDPGPTAVTARVLAQVRPGSIVSLHLGHRGTAAAIPAILIGLQQHGLSPVPLSRLLRGIQP